MIINQKTFDLSALSKILSILNNPGIQIDCVMQPGVCDFKIKDTSGKILFVCTNGWGRGFYKITDAVKEEVVADIGWFKKNTNVEQQQKVFEVMHKVFIKHEELEKQKISLKIKSVEKTR